MRQSADSVDGIDVAESPAKRLERPDRRHSVESTSAQRLSARHRRPALIAFVTDGASEQVLKDGLADAIPGAPDIRRGSVRTAISAMEHAVTPNVLIVDITGEDQPLTALAKLANVVEPDAACWSSAKPTASTSIVRSPATWGQTTTSVSR